MGLFLGIVGIICLIYYAIIMFYSGIGTTFAVIWLVLGVVSLVLALAIRLQVKLPKIGRLSEELIYSKWKRQLLWVRVCIQTTVIAGAVCFLITEGLMVYEIVRPVPDDLDYIVVLGAKLSGNQLEPTMERCLESALDYLEEHPDTQVIVSGNESAYQDITQARIMGTWLIAHGIRRDRIIYENQANSVQENIIYSRALMEEDNPKIGIVTMNFHAYRARMIAAKCSSLKVYTIPSKTDYVLLINSMVREFLAVIKDKMIGNI